MDMAVEAGVIKQHLIDPEICIRCNTCEAICPVNAITHDDNNYVVRADTCNGCMACISPCPTGSIDNWRTMPLVRAYSIEEQLTWEALPGELSPEELEAAGVSGAAPTPRKCLRRDAGPGRRRHHGGGVQFGAVRRQRAALVGRACVHQSLPPKTPTTATVVGNFNCTEAASTARPTMSCWTSAPCLSRCSRASRSASCRRARRHRQAATCAPVLGGQPAQRRAARLQQRLAHREARDRGPRGQPGARRVPATYVCDLKVGDTVQVVGPFGASFLMPNHPKSTS
jgi:benzoyl-CoA 2,3-dioxygenase component A